MPYPFWEHKEAIPSDANARKRIIREYGATRDQLTDNDEASLTDAKGRPVEMGYWMDRPSICGLSLWSYMDYMRGYSPVNSGRGVVNMARLSNFSYFAFRTSAIPS